MVIGIEVHARGIKIFQTDIVLEALKMILLSALRLSGGKHLLFDFAQTPCRIVPVDDFDRLPGSGLVMHLCG